MGRGGYNFKIGLKKSKNIVENSNMEGRDSSMDFDFIAFYVGIIDYVLGFFESKLGFFESNLEIIATTLEIFKSNLENSNEIL